MESSGSCRDVCFSPSKTNGREKGERVNSLSSWEMDSLIALCDTFLPSIDVSNLTTDDSVVKFYTTSASMAGTPERVGALISDRLKHPKKWLMRVALWVSPQKREEIVLSLSFSYFYLLRMLSKAMKILTLYAFFTQVDEKDNNLSWKAIGYSGPDPEFKTQTEQLKALKKIGYKESDEEEDGSKEWFCGPLYRGLINLKQSRDMAANTLRRLGFPVSVLPQKTNPPSLSYPSLIIQCDAIVIGSGSGGGVVAGVLAKAGYKVLVLEKGNYCDRKNLSLLEDPTMDQMYLSSGLLATDDMGVLVLAGSTVGGGSTINWSASIKTPQHVINEWCDHYELELFGSELYKEALDVVCEKMGVQSEFQDEGFNNVTATGVAFEFEYNGAKDIAVIESKVTIVACGAISTPALLKKSGLKNGNIGKNLHLHPVTMAWGYFPDTPLPNVWPEEDKKSYEGGIMTAMSTVVANLDGSGYGAVIQTPSLHPGTFSILMPWISGTDMKNRMCRFSRTAHIFALARDKGSGTVVSPNSISYSMEVADEESLKKGLEKILRILAAAGAEEIGTHHCKGKTLNVKNVGSTEFERFVKEESSRALRGLSMPICSAHQMGSCRMGVDPKKSVVNQMGETWEVEGLFVADTSVFPTALGVNPMVTVQAIAYCTAQSALQVLRMKILC
ncbi:long-chain-alcohol oxidase fao4a [Quercus suber]|uniref:Long-chain-alcohol oxidase n=1 Tax=Quercus suber TaxID=58331 RepID=A0AAW0K7G0_QUESU